VSDPTDLPDHLRVPAPSASAPERTGLGRTVARVVAAALLGLAVAALGTATHRTLWHDLPVGLLIALALTASTALVCRAWAGLGALAGIGAGWLVGMQVLTSVGAGGDVLIVDPGAAIPLPWAGVAWTWGGIVVIGVVAFLPRRWFARR
jgi:hypothetical protein